MCFLTNQTHQEKLVRKDFVDVNFAIQESSSRVFPKNKNEISNFPLYTAQYSVCFAFLLVIPSHLNGRLVQRDPAARAVYAVKAAAAAALASTMENTTHV